MGSFAERLNVALRESGLTMYALAKRSGVSKQNMSKLAAGRREPTWETVQRLALALGVSCDAFRDPELTLPPQGPPPRKGRPPKGKAEPARIRKR
jgi:transcriptional regulator with XRE-family HTH domain